MATPSFHRPLAIINDLNHNIMNNIIIVNIFGTLRSSSPSPTWSTRWPARQYLHRSSVWGPLWAFGASLGPLGDLLGDLGGLLGTSWGPLGRSWGPLGGSLGSLEGFLGYLWGLLGDLGRTLGASWAIFGASLGFFVQSLASLGGSLGASGSHLGAKVYPKRFPEQAEWVKKRFQSALVFQARFHVVLEQFSNVLFNRTRKCGYAELVQNI